MATNRFNFSDLHFGLQLKKPFGALHSIANLSWVLHKYQAQISREEQIARQLNGELHSNTARAKLRQPLPESLKRISGRGFIISVGFNLVDVRDKVHLLWCLGGLSVIESGADVQNGEQSQSNIVCDKSRDDESSSEEDRPSTQQHDDADTEHGIPGGVRLKIGMIGEFGSIKSLCFHTLVKAKVGDGDAEPS